MKRPAKSKKQKYREFLFKPQDFFKYYINSLKIIMSQHKKMWPQCAEDLAVVILDKTTPEEQQAKGRIFKI